MKRIVFGLVAGLVTWFALGILLAQVLGPTWLRWAIRILPVSAASILCGFISRKQGPIWGGILGIFDALFFTAFLWAMGLANYPDYPFSKSASEIGFRSLISLWFSFPVGILGGYIGQLLTTNVSRRRAGKLN